MNFTEEPIWLTPEIAQAIHDRQLAEHGGAAGVRDPGQLESALARPKNLFAYGEASSGALAAAYAFGIARTHPFVDGNKRTAWVAARLFLRLNDVHFTFDKQDALRTVLALAAGEIEESALVDWFDRGIKS